MARKKKMRLCASVQKTFEEGFQEFILDCKSRNLRQGTIIHYEVAINQIYKRVPADTPISKLSEKTMPEFISALREDPNINNVSSILVSVICILDPTNRVSLIRY